MIQFFEALAGFLISRLLWDYIRRRAGAMGEIPIVWFFKTAGMLAVLATILGAFILALAYLIWR